MEPKSHEELTFASLRAWHKRAVRGTLTVMCAVATRARDVTRVPNMRRAQVTHPAPLSRSAFHRSLARGASLHSLQQLLSPQRQRDASWFGNKREGGKRRYETRKEEWGKGREHVERRRRGVSWDGEQGMLTRQCRHPLFLPTPNVPTATLPRLRRQILQRRNAIQRTVGFDRSTHWKQPKRQDAHVRSLGLRLNGSTPMPHTAPCLKEDTSDACTGRELCLKKNVLRK